MYRPTKTEWLIMGGLVFALATLVGSILLVEKLMGYRDVNQFVQGVR